MMRLRSRQSYAPVLVVGLAAAGALAVGVAKAWFTASASSPGLPTVEASVTGADARPLVAALGFVLLAGVGAVLATGGVPRRVVGGLVAAAALGAAVLTATTSQSANAARISAALAAKGATDGPDQVTTTAWWWVALVGSLVCVLVGAAVVVAGAAWPTMGDRYASPGEASQKAVEAAAAHDADDLTEAQLWKALDEGHDPTR